VSSCGEPESARFGGVYPVGVATLAAAHARAARVLRELRGEIMSLFSTVHRESGVTILMVTHTKQLVAYGTRHVELKPGALGAGAGLIRGRAGAAAAL